MAGVQVVVVTGSNGKGSVAHALSYMLRAGGLRVGVIATPSTQSDCCDMVVVDGTQISPGEFANHLSRSEDELSSIRQRHDFTQYHLVCHAAYRYFFEQRVDVIVAETAIGGIGDPTVPASAALALVTNVTREHADVLGPNPVDIARHKAGVVTPKSALILGDEVSRDCGEVFREAAERVDAEVVPPEAVEGQSATEAQLPIDIRSAVGIVPLYQVSNLRLAARAYHWLTRTDRRPTLTIKGTESELFPPNRFEVLSIREKTYVFDSAHNVDGYTALRHALDDRFGTRARHYFHGHADESLLATFRACLEPISATYLSGYHPRVPGVPGYPTIASLNIRQIENEMASDVFVVCGMFLPPALKLAVLAA